MYEAIGKRCLDLVVASVALVLLAPLLALIALAVWLEDFASPLFTQVRVGVNDSRFVIFKFRTMPVDADARPSARARDLELTRVGRFLRRFSLDELPQLINVVRGEMSLVGPRPGLPEQIAQAEVRRANGAARLRPGITGLAQINGYDGMSEEEKAQWDGLYAARVTLGHDLAIMLGTLGYLLRTPPVV